MSDKPTIPLSRLREIYHMARANYVNWGGVENDMSATFRSYVDDELQRLTIEQLRQRITELEAALPKSVYDTLSYALRAQGCWGRGRCRH